MCLERFQDRINGIYSKTKVHYSTLLGRIYTYIAKGHNDFNDANDIYWQKRKTITYFTVCLYIVLQTKVKIGNGILIKSDIILYLQYS